MGVRAGGVLLQSGPVALQGHQQPSTTAGLGQKRRPRLLPQQVPRGGDTACSQGPQCEGDAACVQGALSGQGGPSGHSGPPTLR